MSRNPLKKGTGTSQDAVLGPLRGVELGASPLFPVIVHVVHSLEGGGTERVLVSLLHGFDPERGRHVVVTLRAAGELAARLPDHVACQALGATGRSRTASLRLARVTRQWKTNVIHARNTGCWWDAMIAALLTPGAQLVLGFHGLETGATLNKRQRWLARRGLHSRARFTSVSDAGKRQLCEQAGIPGERVEVLGNGLDLRRFADLHSDVRRDTRRRLGFGDSAFVIGIVGSLTPVKQHAVLISAAARAVSRVPTLRLLIVGDGPLRGTLMDQARAAGIADRLCFTGRCDEIPAMLVGMDAYVCSSGSEGMNNALLEAMAAGLPIVATDVGDNAAVLRDRVEGLLVKPGSVDAIAEALALLADSSALRCRLAVAAQARVKDFTIEQAVGAYERYYQTVTGAPDVRADRARPKAIPPGGWPRQCATVR